MLESSFCAVNPWAFLLGGWRHSNNFICPQEGYSENYSLDTQRDWDYNLLLKERIVTCKMFWSCDGLVLQAHIQASEIDFPSFVCEGSHGHCWRKHPASRGVGSLPDTGTGQGSSPCSRACLSAFTVRSLEHGIQLGPLGQLEHPRGSCWVHFPSAKCNSSHSEGRTTPPAPELVVQPVWVFVGMKEPSRDSVCARVCVLGGLVPWRDLCLWGTRTEHECDLCLNDQLTGKLSKENAKMSKFC